LIALLLGATALLAGCGSAHRSSASAADSDWPEWGGNAQNTHFASPQQVDAANVDRLAVVWRRSEGPEQFGWETFPVVVGSTMYYTTNTDEVIAVSATTGRARWSYTPQVNFLADPVALSVQPVNRGVTVAHGRVYELTWDDQLIALDARSGAPVWDVRVADPVSGAAEDSPSVYWDGEIIIGGPAGDSGLGGFVAAYSATTGARLWRTSVVGARQHGWLAGGAANGGGDVWMAPVVDARTGVVYAATGDPTPAFATGTRAGCDRWTDATIAIDARTGRLDWGYSAICGDAWDYDSDQSPVLFDLRRGGRVVPAIADASKAGFIYVLDAQTGSLVSRSPSLVRYSEPHRVPTTGGVVVCPGIFGGIEYGPSAYSSQTGLLYVAASDTCMRYTAGPPGAARRSPGGGSDLDGTATPLPGASGVVTAVNPQTGHIAWRQRLPQPARGGVLATAGGLVLAGDDNGYLYAFSARSGRVLWRFRTGLRFGSAPFAYEIAGREYIAVAAGGSSATGTGAGLAANGGELYALALPR
jgi:alcohol dehydrogenase (cytochrome c)